MAEVSQNIKYVKLDDGVSFSLVRTNPKLTTNTKLMYNGKKMYMESYMSSELLNRATYKNVPVKQNSTYNKDIANFLKGSGSQAYSIYHNFSNVAISNSYDNQYETLYWCGAEYIDSSFYTEEIGFVAPLYLREKLPKYFLIFRLDTPSNYNFNVDNNNMVLDSNFDFKTDILDKAVLLKTFDLSEGSVLGNYIHNYINQEGFEFDKSMYVNFSNNEVTYYGINKSNGVFEKIVENFENELLRNDNPILVNDKWFTEGFERNGLIFPYIMNIEYLFDDDIFKRNDGSSYDFARYIGVYCNNIEFGEFENLSELKRTKNDVIYYFEDKNKNLHRYCNYDDDLKIDGEGVNKFDKNLISGFEKERITAYAEPLDIHEGFINRSQYGFEILKPLEPGDWIGIKYNENIERYFADNKNVDGDEMSIGDCSDFRFSVGKNSSINDISKTLAKTINRNKNSKFEAKYSDGFVVIYAKRENDENNNYNDAKIIIEPSLLYNRKISLPVSDDIKYVNEYEEEYIKIENAVVGSDSDDDTFEYRPFGKYYMDSFFGGCNVFIDGTTETYKNVFKIFTEEYIFFGLDRYLKTNNGDGRKISANIVYINAECKIDPKYRLVIVEDAPVGKEKSVGYNISVSSTNQVEIMDKFKPNHGVLSWFPVKDFDFDINYSTYGQYEAFIDECDNISKKYKGYLLDDEGESDSDLIFDNYESDRRIKELAKSPFFAEYGDPLETEYDYYYEQYHPELCLVSKSVPYISKWGYYDEQKDSCENPYRLNVSKIFGVSNLSANTFFTECNETEYTHNMPYYMSFATDENEYYKKNYQYIESDDLYKDSYNIDSDSDVVFGEYMDCVEYWINMFKKTDEDMFSYFFSNKEKYGNRFVRKYSRLLGGDKFHNPTTLFRGVKFEAVRQYNGVEKRSSEYNNYKFSFIYIPVIIKSLFFKNKVYFVKNDEFKFIVGIVFVNTMLGYYDHSIFGGDIDYFNKCFLYAACKDLIRPKNPKSHIFKFIFPNGTEENIQNKNSEFCKKYLNEQKLYIWYGNINKITDDRVFITLDDEVSNVYSIVGEYNDTVVCDGEPIEDVRNYVYKKNECVDSDYNENGKFKFLCEREYKDYDITINGYTIYEKFTDLDSSDLDSSDSNDMSAVKCEIQAQPISFKGLKFIEICDNQWEYIYIQKKGYKVDVSVLKFNSDSLKKILIKMGEGAVESIRIYNDNSGLEYVYTSNITVNDVGEVSLESYYTNIADKNGNIDDLMIDIEIKDRFDTNLESLSFKEYFSVFNQLSMYNIMETINSDYGVEYHSTVEDNKYKIRVINPDSIEIEDKYEAVPVEITQNNKSVVGSIDIKEKLDVDKIGVKVINRYSGFYNPIFNDILYYDDNILYYDENIKDIKLPHSNVKINYEYDDGYGKFGIIKNMYYHKTNVYRSDNILTSERPIYPAINEYALDYRDYNIFSSSWDEGYYMSQNDLDTKSVCDGIGSMKDGICMFGSKYLNLPDEIFIDTFENGNVWNENVVFGVRDNTVSEIMYREINNNTIRYYLFIEKRLKRYLKESLIGVFEKYINKNYSFGNKGTIEDDVDEYVEKNLLKLYKVDKVYMYIKSDKMNINDKRIENEYLKYVSVNNEKKIKKGFSFIIINGKNVLKDNNFTMTKTNEFDRIITYNLKPGFKESFGFAISIKRK